MSDYMQATQRAHLGLELAVNRHVNNMTMHYYSIRGWTADKGPKLSTII